MQKSRVPEDNPKSARIGHQCGTAAAEWLHYLEQAGSHSKGLAPPVLGRMVGTAG